MKTENHLPDAPQDLVFEGTGVVERTGLEAKAVAAEIAKKALKEAQVLGRAGAAFAAAAIATSDMFPNR